MKAEIEVMAVRYIRDGVEVDSIKQFEPPDALGVRGRAYWVFREPQIAFLNSVTLNMSMFEASSEVHVFDGEARDLLADEIIDHVLTLRETE